MTLYSLISYCKMLHCCQEKKKQSKNLPRSDTTTVSVAMTTRTISNQKINEEKRNKRRYKSHKLNKGGRKGERGGMITDSMLIKVTFFV